MLQKRGMKVITGQNMCVNVQEEGGRVGMHGTEVKKVQELNYLGSTE